MTSARRLNTMSSLMGLRPLVMSSFMMIPAIVSRSPVPTKSVQQSLVRVTFNSAMVFLGSSDRPCHGKMRNRNGCASYTRQAQPRHRRPRPPLLRSNLATSLLVCFLFTHVFVCVSDNMAATDAKDAKTGGLVSIGAKATPAGVLDAGLGGAVGLGADAVRRHVAWFSTKDGLLTAESMTTGHYKIGVTKGVNLKVTAILNLLAKHFPDKEKAQSACGQDKSAVPASAQYTVDDLLTIVNPARTRIWTDKGRFDEARLANIIQTVFHSTASTTTATTTQAPAAPASAAGSVSAGVGNGGGVKVATRANFEGLLAETAQGAGEATKVYKFIPVPWSKVTSGSMDELLLYVADTTDPATGQPAISAKAIRDFYTDPNAVFERLAAKEAQKATMPLPPPAASSCSIC